MLAEDTGGTELYGCTSYTALAGGNVSRLSLEMLLRLLGDDARSCFTEEVVNSLAPRERDIKVTKNEGDLRDAFLQYELIDDFVVYVGRRRQVWGQFDLFSPVGILLPVRFQNSAIDYKKTNYVVPQDNASISWFLGERLELQGHFFLSTQIDPLLKEVIEMDSGLDVEDHKQYAGRLVYRPDWGTVGLTFYKGRSGLFQYDNASLNDPGSLDGRSADLPPLTAYAFEMAIPSGRWVWKTEIVYRQSKGDLPSYGGIGSDVTFNDDGTCDGGDAECARVCMCYPQ